MIKISDQCVEKLKKWFFSYVETFKHGNNVLTENTILKENHTIRVCNEIEDIGKSLDLNSNKLRLAEITALFHDIGRFEQYARYQTFVDSKSENHALLSVKILENKGILNGFDETLKNLIFRIIKYHNRATLPEKENETCLFFSKLLRDADKLDIWKVVINYYHEKNSRRNSALELDLPDTAGFSNEVYQDLMDKQIVDIRHVKSLNDFKLLQVGWIFDINFDATLNAVRSRHYLEMIQAVLPETKKIQEIFHMIQTYLSEKINEEKFRQKKQNEN
ncbi:MAG: HD domain-containing protein [Desulfobacteraceae bacterium]|nr:HD domain-containing protein [Desulfobacteraceae bacterium]MBC2755743.1 HD domain-containing protein [Desulfobacteraceae bacterium]